MEAGAGGEGEMWSCCMNPERVSLTFADCFMGAVLAYGKGAKSPR